MENSTLRRFNLTDGMVLVAATAAGLAASRFIAHQVPTPPGLDLALNSRDGVELSLACVGVFSTLGVILLRLRRPRPDLRNVFRQPGFAACVAFSVAFALPNIFFGADAATSRVRYEVSDFWYFLAGSWNVGNPAISDPVVCAIASVWLVMAMGGRWEAEPSWVDRAGRVMGVFWIVTVLGFHLVDRVLER